MTARKNALFWATLSEGHCRKLKVSRAHQHWRHLQARMGATGGAQLSRMREGGDHCPVVCMARQPCCLCLHIPPTRNLPATCDSSFTPTYDSCSASPGFTARAPAYCMDSIRSGDAEVRVTFDNFDSRRKLTKTSIAILALRVREVWQAPCLCPYVTERTHAEDLDH
jgi:hypothetical protein